MINIFTPEFSERICPIFQKKQCFIVLCYINAADQVPKLKDCGEFKIKQFT